MSNRIEPRPGALDAAAGIAAERYGNVAVLFHWLVALLILATFPLGVYMADLSFSPAKLKYYSWHKWLGVTIFALAALRLLWRATHRPPPPMPGQPRWQLAAAHGTHVLLYLLMLGLPLSGWLYSSAAGVPTVYLGLWQLPDLLQRDDGLKATLKLVHLWLGYVLAALVLLHVAAALKHSIVDRDGTLARMSLRARPRTLSKDHR